MVQTLGWFGAPGTVARVVVPLLASVAVIVVHHLCYPEFRDARQMVLPVIACGVWTLGFLITGDAITAPVGHMLMHTAAVLHRTALPPYREPAAAGEGEVYLRRGVGRDPSVWALRSRLPKGSRAEEVAPSGDRLSPA